MKELNIRDLQENQSQNQKITEDFIAEHLPIIHSLASRLITSGKVPSYLEKADLVNWGIEGLIKAKKVYKGSFGAHFKTYSFYRIRGEILDRIRLEWRHQNPIVFQDYQKKIRSKIQDYAQYTLDYNMQDLPGYSNEERMLTVIERSGIVHMLYSYEMCLLSGNSSLETDFVDKDSSELQSVISKLEPHEKQFIEMFYFMDMKQIDIAKKLNYSQSKISRLHNLILQKLKTALKEVEKTK